MTEDAYKLDTLLLSQRNFFLEQAMAYERFAITSLLAISPLVGLIFTYSNNLDPHPKIWLLMAMIFFAIVFVFWCATQASRLKSEARTANDKIKTRELSSYSVASGKETPLYTLAGFMGLALIMMLIRVLELYGVFS